ncbi:unnamed protein product [Rodentolepis nana]|uniref:Bee-milk protein n=1 Tax=Rodentolepis nana TaxID=102285 RepID=A0A0R3TL04_RODNA|nr:unnamed protein product [Rodentolepis nana]
MSSIRFIYGFFLLGLCCTVCAIDFIQIEITQAPHIIGNFSLKFNMNGEEEPLKFSTIQVNSANGGEFELLLTGPEWTLNFNFTKYRENTSFVIRNMKITNGNKSFLADPSPKFMTPLTKKFVCSSKIGIIMGNNTILYMANTTLQAFNVEPTGGLIGILRGVDSAGMVVDASGKVYEKEGVEAINSCLTLLNLTSSKVNSTYEKLWESIPSYRFIGLCPENISMVGSLVEMQSHLSFLYVDKNGEKRCRIVIISPRTPFSADFLAMVPRNASRPTNISEVKENYMRNTTSTPIISESNMTYCDNKTRKMGFYLDPIDRKDQPMRIELTWRRKPEYYEDSEFGWSSVGAHLGVLSGIFSLAEVKLHFNGTWLHDSYSDFRVTCGDDIHADHTITIAIGSTVCAIVLISLIGIVLTRLYDRDKEMQSYEVEYCKMTEKGLLKMVPPPAYQRYEMKTLNKHKPTKI